MKDNYSGITGPIDTVDDELRRKGLCTFCAARTRCALIEPACMPVLECEEFRAISIPEKSIAAKDSDPDTNHGGATSSEPAEHTDWGQKGLCGNCAICDSCPFSKDEGGVWRCEEYR